MTGRIAMPRLELIVTESLDWMQRGACASGPKDMWFPKTPRRGRHYKTLSPESIEAKRICNEECPVREECRTYALDRPEPLGIWGGLDEHERDEILRRRARA